MTTPKTRKAFWADKFKRNIQRDAAQKRRLRALGWNVLVVWECETFAPDTLSDRLAAFFADRHVM
jgi:DNA mismatch endonuclease (patch repair protein)